MGWVKRNFDGSGRPHILVVDDDEGICDLLSRYLTIEKYEVSSCLTGNEIWDAIETFSPHLIILDLHLPDVDGFAVAERLYDDYNIPFIMLTARDTMSARVHGLQIGADDYITKPFDLEELLARIQAVLRRSFTDRQGSGLRNTAAVSPDRVISLASTVSAAPASSQSLVNVFDNPQAIIYFDGWRLLAGCRSLVSPQGSVISLPQAEYEFLGFLLKNANKIFTRDKIMADFWGRPLGPSDRTVDVFIAKLRRKLETDINAPTLLRTVHRQGYIFTADVKCVTSTQ
jgi:DNA-binding response OmpR family regulator